MSFPTFDSALQWALTYARENCRPCDKWKIVKSGKAYLIEISFRSSGKFIGFAS